MPDTRPTSVKVVCIMAMGFGGLGVLGGLCSLPQYMGLQLTPNPIMDAMRNDALLNNLTIASLIVGVVLAILELASGIGAYQLRPWGRKGLLVYACLNLFVTIAGLIVSFAIMAPRMARIIQNAIGSNPQLNSPTMAMAMKISQYVGHAFQVLTVVWTLVVLYVMTRPNVKAAFEGAGGGAGGGMMPA
jgi:hypothetical protein